MFTETEHRVERLTEEEIEECIRQKTEETIACHALAGREAIDRRLEELDREWDIERCLQLSAASISLAAIVLGATRSRRWYFVPFFVSVFLLQHAVQGWGPPVALFRRLGFRTRSEIEFERMALKILRGDLKDLKSVEVEDQRSSIHEVFEAVRR